MIRGPLQGVHGIFLRKEERHRLVLGVRLIQQAAAVEIDVNDVVPAWWKRSLVGKSLCI